MAFTNIKKRNGQIVEFEPKRIEIAIQKASDSADNEIPHQTVVELVENVISHLESLNGDNLPDVESIQDLVEQELMRADYYKTARSYILYRERHKELREFESNRDAEKLEHNELKVTLPDGSIDYFSYTRLIKDLVTAAEGIESSIDIDELAQIAKSNLYDGITLEELQEALVLAAKSCIEKDHAYSTLAARLLLKKIYREVIGTDKQDKLTEAYKETFRSFIKSAVKTKRLDSRLLEFDLDKLADHIDPARDGLFDYMGLDMLHDRYFIQNEGRGVRLETPQILWMRIAMGLAVQEKKTEREKWAKKFYDTLSTLRYVPSTPTLFHSGTTFAQLSSCFLNTVEDDLKHIFKVYLDTALMSKFSGGIATDWTNIRSTGSMIKAVNIPSQGVIPFLKIANDCTVAISRSGKRKGATCVYLETWHMDIEDFLELRKNTGDERRRTHDMNTANWIPDLFMKRVLNDEQWTLFSPNEVPELHHTYGQEFEKKYVEYEKMADEGKLEQFKRIPALQLWRKMLTMLFETGHPWINFKDACNVRSPQDHAGVIHNSNLCTEITLNNSAEETAVCNLGSVNLARHITGKKLDRDMVADTVTIGMRMLDNVIDINYYTTDECKVSNMRHRPVGLGIMGFQDALYMLDIAFNSEKAVSFGDESMELVSYYAILGSSQLAKERGAYKSYKGSKWDRGIFPVDTLDLLEKERGIKIDVKRRGKLDWKPVRAHVKKHGMRNSNTMAIAPTASISNISGCYPCIEPIYKNLYVKSNMSGDFTIINSYMIDDLKKNNLWNDEIMQKIKFHDGSVQKITEIPAELRAKYQEVFEIDAEWLVKIAAHRGKWIDQSQSLNIFVQGVSGKKLSDIYTYAWKMGLKTTYYLRSLAASQVEKSTVDTAEFGNTHKREYATVSEMAPKADDAKA
ncbi:MAG: ribonucleoside-diphosphate reductase alpha chain [Patescibacteria group bacterium]|jgi:ribonucleoside-diphosphate reductase alpha chain|nr:ribonucleoside-diphosphate reductase alpha chain [Patescibacteria group bacterium]